ncbi:MAG: hypothetical protein CO186_12695 [Zetaproteobacteria bacterium CG_4_9_14_3_um_filter_49_83]|nr:MAG: hypothetical protein AUJ56_01600 [Zetaproteobacteria bacterium CG1_02_49_23]PIQ30340.1 MAG: hypothetical protein COW62_12760 [Zetaproteobacteria bacterium CG17_big_fil_post_rev_8_21_14_2_50_50_13]PIV31389.1 MAG: hypothetical protein COS35_01630 [Zetaproteobacteria bacterium CG02_land_8_20_14_3_00_50_9]PIY56593.1 MAG: hypothetical protein COZ00_03375 [Zetaproteobacteria bacterium CG_4_10_14_0_8_um_filter_49_80]PJA33819.1 MAG: hypothetical protein CO186_12695 [Zetaproteobacteria bacterium
MFKRIFFTLLATLALFPSIALASLSLESVQGELDTFRKSADFSFAKSTAQRAQAYLGAAMLANDEDNEIKLQEALEKALATIKEAETNARLFRQQHQDLITRQQASVESLKYLSDDARNKLNDPNPFTLMNDAEQKMDKVIQMAETGQLNASQQAAGAARVAYKRVLDVALPDLIDQCESTISDAAAKNGKSYAPVTYEKAKTELDKLKQYFAGKSSKLPDHPALALLLARQALEISLNVKSWRKATDSHEALVLKARDERMEIARELDVELQALDLDISAERLIQQVKSTLSALNESNQSLKAQMHLMDIQHQQELQKQLAGQKETLLLEQDTKLSDLKDAYRAKIERETFEIKRQKKLMALFEKGEADLVANLDGSILIHLSKLKFAPSSVRLDAEYFDFLGRIKAALELYGDRNIRIEGHTDNQGELKDNQELSLKRAEAVREFLIAAGEDASRLKAFGYGEVRPIASNDFVQGLEMNRRIDLVIEARGE